MEVKINPKKILLFLAVLILSLLTLSIVLQIYKFGHLKGSSRFIIDLFDLDKEFNIPTLFQTLHLFIVSAVLWGVGLFEKETNRRLSSYWRVISIVFALAACDELLEFHERLISPLQEALKTGGFLQNAWVIPGGAFVLVFALYLLKFFKSIPKKTAGLFLLAAGIYLAGALGIEMIGAKLWTTMGSNNLLYAIIANIEESSEMIGLLVFDYALLDYLRSNARSLVIRFTWSGVSPLDR